MIASHLIKCFVLAVWLLVLARLSFYSAADAATAPSLVLTSYGSNQVTIPMGQPLELRVVLTNPDFRFERLRALTSRTKLQADRIAIGRQGQKLSNLVSFKFTDLRSNTPVAIQTRAIDIWKNGANCPVALGAEARYLLFGIDSDAIGKIQPGKYKVRAYLSFEDNEKKSISSNEIVVAIDKTTKVTEKQLYQFGRYVLRDKKFDRVDNYVKELLAINENSVAAYELRGDAMFGLGRLKDARVAYLKAIDLLQLEAKDGEGVLEPPTYLERRLEQLRQ